MMIVENMKTILVVDDEKCVRDVIKEFLEIFGYKVMVTSNGEKGIKYFNSNCVDLVITDIRMPIMDGYKFARAIRNSDSADTPIIAITGYFIKTNKENDLFNSIVDKPFNLNFLGKIVSENLKPIKNQ